MIFKAFKRKKQEAKSPASSPSVSEERHCLNCETRIKPENNFCPDCGQKTGRNRLSLSEFIHDIFSNYFGYDSQLVKSIRPFLFKPGHLTREFNRGRRKAFVHPFRLYLVLSIFFFFTLSLNLNRLLDKNADTLNVLRNFPGESSPTPADSVSEQQLMKSDSLSRPLQEAIKGFQDSQEISEKEKQELRRKLLEISRQEDAVLDSLKIADPEVKKVSKELMNWGKLEYLSAEYAYLPTEVVMDSMKIHPTQRTPLNRSIISQSRKLLSNDVGFFINFLKSNLPLLVLLMLPVFALLLKLFFRRTSYFYMEHMVHALHLHALAFLLFGTGWLMLTYLPYSHYYLWAPFALVTVYAFMSFKNVYQRRYKATFFRFMLLGGFYFFFLLVGFLIEAMVSFILY